MHSKRSFGTFLLLILGILVLINILSSFFFFRIDLTGDNRFTLSKATRTILSELDATVTVTAYFTEDLPADVAKVRRDFRELLVEYGNLSKGKVVFEFIDPNKDTESEQKAMQAGIQPLLVNLRDKDQVKQQKIYLGAVVGFQDKTEVLAVIRPEEAMEFALSTAIKKLTRSNKPPVAYLQGHGEPPLSSLPQAMQALEVLYNVQEITFTDSTDQLSGFSTLILIHPQDSIPPSHFLQLDRFLARGGKIVLAADRIEGDLNTQSTRENQSGIEKWLGQKGLVLENKLVIDVNAAAITVRQQQGMFTFNSQVQFHYFPVIQNFADHPVSKGLEAVLFQFVSPLMFVNKPGIQFTPLLKTSDKSGTEAFPIRFDITRQWSQADFPERNLTVAGVLSGKLAGNAEASMVVIGDGDFVVNGGGQSAQQQQPDNINLLVNAVDWVSDETGLIELRTKGVTSRPLDQLEDGTKTLLKYLNFILPMVLVILYGIYRVQANRALRMKRMEAGFVD